jgi:hypothetical protein
MGLAVAVALMSVIRFLILLVVSAERLLSASSQRRHCVTSFANCYLSQQQT